nr:hypothetical protein [Tanacetum cinerariifolium]
MDNKKHIVNLESLKEMLHICPRLPGQAFVEPPFEEVILAFLHFLGHNGAIRRLIDVEHKDTKNRNEMYYPRFTKVIIHHFMSKDPSIPRRNKVNWYYVRDDHMFTMIKLVSRHQNTQQFSLRLTTFEKGKQAAKASKAKSLSALFEVAIIEAQQLKLATKRSLQQTHISQASGSCADEGTGIIPGVLDVPTDESEEEISWNYTDEEADDDEGKDGDGKKDTMKRKRKTNYTETSISILEGSSSVSSQFVTSMLNPTPDAGMESIFESTSQMDVQIPTSVAPLPMYALTLTPLTIATISTTQQAPTPPTAAPSTLLQDLPNFSSLFEFDHQLKTLEANFSEFTQTNQFAGAVSFIPRITVNEQLEAEVLTRSSNSSKTSYAVAADLSEMELKMILIEKIEGNKYIHRSNEQRNLYKALVEAYESDKIIFDKYGDTVMLKRRHDDDADRDEEPSAGSDRGSKIRREGKESESASALQEKATRSTGKSTQGSKS